MKRMRHRGSQFGENSFYSIERLKGNRSVQSNHIHQQRAGNKLPARILSSLGHLLFVFITYTFEILNITVKFNNGHP